MSVDAGRQENLNPPPPVEELCMVPVLVDFIIFIIIFKLKYSSHVVRSVLKEVCDLPPEIFVLK